MDTAAEIPKTPLKKAWGPLRKIVARPTLFSEQLECGHVIPRPLGLGEYAQAPSKANRRRCWHCKSEA